MQNLNCQKNYFLEKPLSLEDSKWDIYNINNRNIYKEKTRNITNENKVNYNAYQNENLQGVAINNQIQTLFPINNNDLDIKLENIKNSLYSKMNQNSTKIVLYMEKIQYLTEENISLKKKLKNKNQIIADFESLFSQFKEKFNKMDNLNQLLRNKLLNKNEPNKELNTEMNQKDLLTSFNNIKEDLKKIEIDYGQKLKEKDEILEKMNQELLYIHNEYKKLTDILEKIGNYVMNSDYNELKNKINGLLKEKEILLEQNEKREKRIIDLQKRNEQIYEKDNDNENDYNTTDNNELIMTFKNQENEYVKTINMLQNRIIEKDKEIEMIKDEYSKIIEDKENSNE